MVDVAAPGVAIRSSAPGNEYIQVSGTSQAAPFVAGVAGKIIDTNPELSPLEVKKIIMGTVDKKDFLAGKVITNGIVNLGRAIRAADISRTSSVDEAIKVSLNEVNDVPSSESVLKPVMVPGMILPLTSQFK